MCVYKVMKKTAKNKENELVIIFKHIENAREFIQRTNYYIQFPRQIIELRNKVAAL